MKHLILISLLSMLAGCGGGSNTTKLEVSKAFAMSNGYYAGGLIVYGESSNGNKFSVALDSNLQTTLTLANGTWSFYAIGWDGGSFDKKFEGVKHCGATTQEISSASTVDISVSAAACSTDTAFVNAIKPTNITPSSCGAFYIYNDVNNEYAPATAGTPANFCSTLPIQFRSPYSYYRVAAEQKINGVISTKYLSECKLMDVDFLSLPTAKIPLTIQKFKTGADCTSGVANNFTFPDGIEAGNDQNFEHKLLGGNLLLPSSKTRRGSSPFMNMQPRILCGAYGSYDDCFSDIDTLGMKAAVPWEMQTNNDQLLFKNTTATSCPPAVLDDAKYFNVTNCTVRENNIYGSVNRNELTCQPTTSTFTNILDIYSANGNIYILKDNGANDLVQIYNFKGQKQNEVSLNVSDANKIAVSSNAIFVLRSLEIKKYDFAGTPLWNTTVTADDIDVSPSGTKLAVAFFSVPDVVVNTYDAASGSLIDSEPGGSASGPFKIAYEQGSIFTLDNASGMIKKFPVDAGGLLSAASNIATDANAINIIRSVALPYGYYTLGSDSSVKRFDSNATSIPTNLTGAIGNNFAITDATSYKFFFTNGSYLKMSYAPGSTLLAYSTHANECTDAHSITSGGSTQTLSYKTKKGTAYHAYAEAMKFLGRRTISQVENVSYILLHISHDEDEIKAGGLLELAQDDLSSTGLAGLLGKDYPTCDLLKTKVSDGSTVSASRYVYLPHTMDNVKISLNVTKSSTTLPPFICVDADPSGTGCPGGSVYDLDLSFNITHGSSSEKGHIKLKCNKKLGSYENMSLDDEYTTRRELSIWNTEDDSFARFEKYEITDESNGNYGASIAKLQKSTTNDFMARQVSVESKPSDTNFYGSVVGLQRITSAPDKIFTKRTDYSETDISNFFSTHSVETSISTFQSLVAPSCGDPAASIFSAHIPGCTFNGTPDTSSKGFVLRLNSFSDNNQTAFRGVFEIP